MDSFGKIIAILISVLVLFIAPVLYLAQKQDAIVQNYVTRETIAFVDAVKNNGYLTKDMYDTYIQKLADTDNLYDIFMEHGHKIINPVYSDADIFQNDISIYYSSSYEDDILDKLYETGIYQLQQEDYLSVQVMNRNKTLAAKLQQIIYASEVPEEQILVHYGGIIRDENY